MKTQSRAFRTSDWAEGSPSNRTMTLSTQQESIIDNSVNVLEWPSQSLSLNPIKLKFKFNIIKKKSNSNSNSNISGETWKCASAPIQPDRAWEVKRWGEKWQIIAKCWWTKLVTSNKKRPEAVKVLQLNIKLRVWILMQCTYFSFFFFLLIYEVVTILFLLCQYGVWCVDWCGGKTNLKQLNIRQQHNKTWKNEGVWILSQGTVIVRISPQN